MTLLQAPAYEQLHMPSRTHKQWWGVTLDAPDARALARFYARLLDWQLFEDDGGNGASVAPFEHAGYRLASRRRGRTCVRWPGEPQMSMHVEIEVDDLDEAVVYAVSVGAELAGYQPQSTVRVMLDFAGHPFAATWTIDVGLRRAGCARMP